MVRRSDWQIEYLRVCSHDDLATKGHDDLIGSSDSLSRAVPSGKEEVSCVEVVDYLDGEVVQLLVPLLVRQVRVDHRGCCARLKQLSA
jgi:hypothetical protein